jgi:hypothetical protein
MDKARIDYLANNGNSLVTPEESEFDSVFLIDRTADYITPLKTQFTYEGLVDELFGIRSSFLEVDPSIFHGSRAASSVNSKPRKILLNGSDLVFKEIRNVSFEGRYCVDIVVGDLLNEIAKNIKAEEDSRHSMTTPTQLKDFASKLGVLQSKRSALDIRKFTLY